MQSTTPKANVHFTRSDIVEVDGAEIACHRHGRGQKIICLHATGHSSRDFVRLAHSLEDRFEFIALDWPGQGNSPRTTPKTSAQYYARVLGSVIDALELQNYFILGNSIGGAAAIIHASQSPEHLRGLVLCNPGGLQPVNLIAKLYCRHVARMFEKGEQGAAGFTGKFKRYYEKTVLTSQAAAWRRNEIISTAYDIAPILREAWDSFVEPEADIRALIPKLSMPILYAWARGDSAVAWSRSKKAALKAPNHTVKMFDGGHCAFLECPDAFRESLINFTDNVSTR